MSNLSAGVRPWGRSDVPLLSAAEAAGWDRRAVDRVDVPERVLMENAGRAAALVLQRLYPEGPVLVVAGGGNNGGDALVTARTLAAWGREVRVVLVSDRPVPDPLAHGWPLPVVPDVELDASGWTRLLDGAGIVVDGILGTGVRGAPRDRQAAAIRVVNDGAKAVLAMDVPSGIDPTTGAVPGDAIRADVTVAFGAPKLGSLLHPARARVGRLVAVEIGFPPLEDGEASARAATPEWVRLRLPRRGTDTHKNAVGRVLVVGGGKGMAGAVVLAARGALRAGAGIVRVATIPENREIVQTAVPEALWVDATDGEALSAAADATDAAVVGPGLGQGADARGALHALVSHARPSAEPALLLDADALNLAAQGLVDVPALAATRTVLLTPHPGEMRRLLPTGDADPATRAREASQHFGCAVLLKGAPSVVASPAEMLLVDTQGSSALAAAGMGDTLSGVCGTLLAQGLDGRTAAAVGLYLTGRAAHVAGQGVSLTPSDVVAGVPRALAEIQEGWATRDPALGLPLVTFDADPVR